MIDSYKLIYSYELSLYFQKDYSYFYQPYFNYNSGPVKINMSLILQKKRYFIILLIFVSSFSLVLMLIQFTNSNQNRHDLGKKKSHNQDLSFQTGAMTPKLEKMKLMMLSSWEQEAAAKGLLYSIPKQFQGAIIKNVELSKSEKVIALTFDDGPWNKNTDKILDILKQNNVKATFFMLGESLANFPQAGKRIAEEGHALGNHTWHHFYHRMNQQVAMQEIESTGDLIYKTTGTKTTLFRPPGGIMNNGVADYAKKHDYTVVMWSDDSIDYSRPSVPVIVNRVIKQAKPGGIILMHDGGGNRSQTIEALPQIITKLKVQGYSFVTIPKLLKMQASEQNMQTRTSNENLQRR